MIKRPMLLIACVFLLGTCCGYLFHWCYITAVILIFLSMFLCYGKRRQWKKLFLWYGIVSVVFLAAQSHIRSSIIFRERYLKQISDGEVITIQGEISKKQIKNGQCIYELTDCLIVQSGTVVPCNHVLVPISVDEYPIQKILIVEGKVNTFQKASNEGGFDEQEFYRSQKIDFQLKDPKVIQAYGEGNRYLEMLYQWRLSFQSVLYQITEEKTAGILSGMLLGEKSMLDTEIKNLYQRAGISHVLAISALHISIFAMGIYQLLRKKGLGFLVSGITAGAFVMSFAFLTGNSVSTQRAAGMFCIFMAAAVFRRSYDMLSGLGILVILLLWQNPFLIHYSGFVFSLAAVLGIGFTVQILTAEEAESLGCRVKKAVSGGVGIWITTLPVAAYYYYEIPVYSVLVNLILVPFLSVILVSSALGVLVGNICIPFGRLLVYPAYLVLKLYEFICTRALQWPGAQLVTGKPKMWEMAVYYTCLAFLLYLRHRRILSMQQKEQMQQIHMQESSGGSLQKKGRFPFIYLGFLLLAAVFCCGRKPGMEVDYLDVGQGDGIFISAGDGNCFFIDGGSSSEAKVGTYQILPFLKAKAVQTIDYWFVSHADADHVSGLKEVLESGYPVEYLVFSEQVPKDGAWEELADAAEAAGTQVMYLKKGDALQMQDVRFECLYPFWEPELSPIQAENVDRNDWSMVLLLQMRGNSFLFSGDISEAQEEKLVQEYPFLQAEVYKAAHHGSKYSNSAILLQQLQPRYAIVSCGLRNSYGHPGAEAVSNMEEAGAEVFYTMNQGQIRIRVDREGELEVDTYLDGEEDRTGG